MNYSGPRSDRPVTRGSAPESRLDSLKRASLQHEAERAAWQLGALVRRAQHEAPEVYLRLRSAVEALQVLAARLAIESAEKGRATPARDLPTERERPFLPQRQPWQASQGEEF